MLSAEWLLVHPMRCWFRIHKFMEILLAKP